MLAISDKVVIRADDLLTWMDHGHEWQWGLQANSVQAKPQTYDEADLDVPSLKSTQLDFGDVNEEKGIQRTPHSEYFQASMDGVYCG